MKAEYLFPSILVTEKLSSNLFLEIKKEIEENSEELYPLLESDVWGDNVQSTHNKCKCIITQLNLQKTGGALIPLVNEYLNGYLFKNKRTSLSLHSSWINVVKPAGYQNTHIHNSNLISGVLYIDVPLNSGSIEFSPSIHEIYYKSCYDLTPESGHVVIFHGMTPHRVKHNKSLFNRISLSFNYEYKLL